MASPPETVIATYRVRADQEDAFFELLRRHHPTLVEVGLATPQPPVVYRSLEGERGPTVYEIFTWVDGDAARVAHETPEVMRIWEAMGTMVEERDGRPKFEFPHVARVELGPPHA